MKLIKCNLLGKMGFLLFFCLTVSISSIAQSNSGKDFYVAFGKNDTIPAIIYYQITDSANIELMLRITALKTTEVNLSFTENPTALDTTFTVPAGTIYDYLLTVPQARASYSGNLTRDVNKKSIRVTADQPITLIALNSAKASVEATLVLPVGSWGKEYYNIGISPYYNLSIGETDNCNGFIVIANEDNTVVNVVSATAGNSSFTLDKGGVYHYYGSRITTLGANITASNPVAFFNTNTKGSIITNGTYMYNYNFEQLMPVNQWGTDFIAPTDTTNAGFFRVYTSKIPTKLTMKYSNGIVKDTIINYQQEIYRYIDIIMDVSTVSGAKACYIHSDNPVGICSFTKSRGGTAWQQPAIAWLPSLEQRVFDVFLSPLDFNGHFVYLKMSHFLTIITPTAGKARTTLSLDGAPPRPIEEYKTNFLWIADDIGGSGYSFGIYRFGQSYVYDNQHLNTTALVYNPDGLIALAYGTGSYTNYSYSVGSAYRDLTASFTVNDVNYIDVDMTNFCETSFFVFKSSFTTPTDVVWKINGEIKGSGLNLSTTLPDGFYTVEMLANNNTYTTNFFVGGYSVIWTPNALAESDRYDWNNKANWTPAIVPAACNNVYIPGNSVYYPVLTSNEECNNIYFMQGAELGHPELLTYKKAFVQMNFGLKQTKQITDENDNDLLLKSSCTNKRMLYSAAESAAPIERERWYMLSSPLREVVTGDLGFGGFPLTFLKKFGPVIKDNQNYSVGTWTTSYKTMIEPIASNPTDGFAFYMYGYGMTGNDQGCEETGIYGSQSNSSGKILNDLDYLPNVRSGQTYGIGKTNGILELPFFADSIKLYSHRTQVYNDDSGLSSFYYVGDGVYDPTDFNMVKETTEEAERDSINYRFSPDTLINNAWVFRNPLYHPVDGLNDMDVFLAGNPYMSSINVIELCRNNKSIYPEFKIWNGKTFNSYSVDTISNTITAVSGNVTDASPYISPMQGFFLTYKGGDVAFDVTKISTVRPPQSSFNLRNSYARSEENILRIKAENSAAVSYTVIGYRKGASEGFVRGEDVSKLFSPNNNVSEIYSLAGEMPVDINFIDANKEVIIPLGINAKQTGTMQLTFTGMDNYSKVSEIDFIDALKNKTVNLTGMTSYTYSFDQTEKGISKGRFSLRFGKSMTSLPNVDTSGDDLKIYGDSKGIYVVSSSSDPVQQVIVYDLQGRKLFESTSGANYYPFQGNFGHSPLIVNVRTKNQVKTMEINH